MVGSRGMLPLTRLHRRYGMEESEGNECIICLTDPKEVHPQQSPALLL